MTPLRTFCVITSKVNNEYEFIEPKTPSATRNTKYEGKGKIDARYLLFGRRPRACFGAE